MTLPALDPCGRAPSTPISSDVYERHDVFVPMRDGVRLACDIYQPAREAAPLPGAYPVILERTPYDKVGCIDRGRYFARHGYVFVAQDVRGRYRSEGEWYAFAHEAPDGYDTVEWIAKQPWCNGKVGTMGASYCASDQSALATLNPPHLSAMVPRVGAHNYHHASMRHNGAMELRFVIYAFRMATTSREAQADARIRSAAQAAYARADLWLRRLPLEPSVSPLRFLPSYERWIRDVLTHGDYDEYWQQRGYAISHYYDQHADVPTYYMGGWYDSYARSTCENFVELRRRKRSLHKLIMGPWTHGGDTVTYAGDVDFGPQSKLDDLNYFHRRWFDHVLKGEDNGIDREQPVIIFVMGGGSGRKDVNGRLQHGGYWRFENEWPLARARKTPFYLHYGGGLSPEPPAVSEPSRYTFDPADPVPTIGGNISAGDPFLLPGGYDQRGDPRFMGTEGDLPLNSRPDVLTFQTEPLSEDLEVTGPIEVTLYASSSALDTDFTAKLLDVYPPGEDYPDGFALNLTDSIIRARYRHSDERPTLLQLGKVEEFRFALYPTSNVFRAGHRIRVDVSSSNFPRFDVNPNTGGPIGRERRRMLAHQAIYHDPEHPSHIALPLVPLGE
ncbi:MAG: CocE/NonD family hydrolase [Anaerolineae bacterium]|nr:CocE/NonD family hydrolase [Anaerolineae bacterium]